MLVRPCVPMVAFAVLKSTITRIDAEFTVDVAENQKVFHVLASWDRMLVSTW